MKLLISHVASQQQQKWQKERHQIHHLTKSNGRLETMVFDSLNTPKDHYVRFN